MSKREIVREGWQRLARLSRLSRGLVLATEMAAFLAAGFLAFELRFDFHLPSRLLPHLWVALAVWMPVKTLVFAGLRLDRGWWRYVSVHDAGRLAQGTLAGSLASAPLIVWLTPSGFPRSVFLLDLLVCFLLTAGARMTARVAAETAEIHFAGRTRRRALIYGAGAAGLSLLRELRQNPALNYHVAGFIDDDPRKQGWILHGAQVLGQGEALPDITRRTGAEVVLIAIPSANGAAMSRILLSCHQAGIEFRTVPGLGEMIEGKGLTRQIREVAVEDLLGRGVAKLDETGIRNKLAGRTVLVTGAGGSIGSELCRQIARFEPEAIVGLDAAETPLFHIEREIADRFPGVVFQAEIGSIRSPARLEEIFTRHVPSVLYHAAAYKHVPMMEQHPFEAVENNVFGTQNVALAAARHGVGDFVMISSDKAVHPTNIMGATKRVAEMLIRSLDQEATRFVSVRFGNVLGSNGSVVPLFREQIARGGPVTVTHPEMRRYFMTIPEAAQLVLQASSMGKGGEIFVLDMGDSVRIQDLARNMILLSGLRPEEDVRIEFTGVRAGEKLYEELNLRDENILATPHEKIRIFAGSSPGEKAMAAALAPLREACDRRSLGLLLVTLKELAPDYNPSSRLLRRLLEESTAAARFSQSVARLALAVSETEPEVDKKRALGLA